MIKLSLIGNSNAPASDRDHPRKRTRRDVAAVRHAELAVPVSCRHLLELRTVALGVEHQRARVAAQQVAPVRADLAQIVVVLVGDAGTDRVREKDERATSGGWGNGENGQRAREGRRTKTAQRQTEGVGLEGVVE